MPQQPNKFESVEIQYNSFVRLKLNNGITLDIGNDGYFHLSFSGLDYNRLPEELLKIRDRFANGFSVDYVCKQD